MSFLKALRARWRAIVHPRAADRELSEEIRFHIELETEKNIHLGMSESDARRVAMAHFGGVQRVREDHRDVRRLQWIEDFAGDVRFALRTLRRTPALSGAAILTLALGIGANVAIFSAVNAVVLQPLPFPGQDRLMMIGEDNPEKRWKMEVAAPANFLDWREGVLAFEDAMAYVGGLGTSVLTGQGDPALLTTSYVTGNFFSVLGARPALGRTLVEEETWDTSPSVVVLSDRTWRTRFGSDPSIVGKSITLGGNAVQVVGVTQPGFAFPAENVDAWRPIGWSKAERGEVSFRRAHWIRVVARLKPDVDRELANTQLQSVVERLKRDYPATNKVMGATMVPLHEYLVGDTRLPLLVLLASVAALLLIACANVGNLLLVQAAGRERETSLRLALGAGRARLARQALAESFVLSMLGGASGLALGWAGTHWLVRLQPPRMLRVHDFGIDTRVLAYVAAITIGSALLFGVAPALWMRRRDPAESLKEGGRGAAHGRRARRWANVLVAGEVALALLMTVGAGLLVRSLWQMRNVEAGFDPRGVLTVRIGLDRKYDSVAKAVAFINQLMERSRSLPGVSNVATTTSLPLTGAGYTSDYIAAGRPADGYGTEVKHRTVSPDYFTTMRVALKRGRVFTASDVSDGPGVVLINETLAKSYFAGQDPVGQRIAFDKVPTAKTTWYTILGVVGSENEASLDVAPRPEVYESSIQSPSKNLFLLLRTDGDPANLTSGVRAVVRDLDPSLALYSVRTMEEVREASMAKARFLATLLLMFAAIGVVLAVVGVYGVLAQVARNRTREMGIRIALGAQAGQVRWLVIRQGLALTAVGLVLGGTAALLTTGAMSKLLFQVAPNDPVTLIGVSLTLAATSVLASWIPALKASRADPAIALRDG
jgi:predicted permease